jgi:hypothetical protein
MNDDERAKLFERHRWKVVGPNGRGRPCCTKEKFQRSFGCRACEHVILNSLFAPSEQQHMSTTLNNPNFEHPGMSRIVIIGNAGGGKSTLERKLAARRRLPHIEVDRLL